jgi:hypothetical protein
MKKQKKLLECFVILVILLYFSGCADTSSQIIGKWQPVESVKYKKGGENEVTKNPTDVPEIEFFKDNTLLMENDSGKWSILEDGRIKLDLGFIFDIPVIAYGSLTDDTLTINIPDDNGYVIFKKKN